MSDINEIIKGGYDLHVHSAPDCLPRKMDDIEMGERITQSALAGYAIKNHWTSTAGRAQLIHKMFPECDAVGTITLNSAVGGLNPPAVEMAARSGVIRIQMMLQDRYQRKPSQLHIYLSMMEHLSTIVK